MTLPSPCIPETPFPNELDYILRRKLDLWRRIFPDAVPEAFPDLELEQGKTRGLSDTLVGY